MDVECDPRYSYQQAPPSMLRQSTMASTLIRSQRCLLLFLLLLACCFAQRTDAYTRKGARNLRDNVLLAPRGGEVPLLDDVEDALVDIGIKPWVQKHTLLIGKAIISSFFVAQILAYLGVIGDKGEGLYEWAVENKSELRTGIRKLGLQPGGFLRVRLEQMLISFANLPDRAQFVTCVSIGATVFPLLIQTVAVTAKVTLVTFLLAEVLARTGIISDAGEGLREYMEDSEPIIRSIKRWMNQTRRQLRKRLQLGELFRGVFQSLEKDRVFWAGLGVGAIAGMVLDKDKVSQGMN